ncbi:MAG: hypothetical protein KF875_02395 [Trueperaceae bacterium]|nr:hypothetical protein [Trueperaceae bacterium]MCO5172964.1 hypothetical protein [Trueperaceae bacterium]MCW5820542.1 hypothetical protein [Trueperaceae bacterium]
MGPRLESIALELLEYKVEEYGSTRLVRGGLSSVWELLGMLNRERERLSAAERARLDEAARTMASTSEGQTPLAAVPSLVSLVLDDEGSVELAGEVPEKTPTLHGSTPEEREEHAVLQRLARRVWWDDLEQYVQRVAAGWRAERDRFTARLVFATLQNLQRNADRSTFGHDPGPRVFRVIEPIPTMNDPLVSLSDLDSLAEIVRELINVVMTSGKVGNPLPPLERGESGTFAYVRNAALSVANDPYAGRMAPDTNRSVTSTQLRLALQELGKERLPEEERAAQRRDLERRLVEVSAKERSDRQAFQRDTGMFTDLVEAFFGRLAGYLPTSVGGEAAGPQLEGGILFGVNPILRWDKVPPGATSVTVRMVGPLRLALAGHDLAIAGVGRARTLYLDGEELELDGSGIIQRDRLRLGAFREGDYVHLRIRNDARSLGSRLADALVVNSVLTSPQRSELLAVFKVIANNVRGEPNEVVDQAVARANVVAARAPDKSKALDGLLRGAARAAGVLISEPVMRETVGRLAGVDGAAVTDVAAIVAASGASEHQVKTITDEPMTFDLANLKITVRQYRGRGRTAQESLVAMLPGQVLGSFADYLLVPRPNGTLLFARGEEEVAVLFLPAPVTA